MLQELNETHEVQSKSSNKNALFCLLVPGKILHLLQFFPGGSKQPRKFPKIKKTVYFLKIKIGQISLSDLLC